MSMKNCSDAIGNRIRDLPARSTVPQPNEPQRAPLIIFFLLYLTIYTLICLGIFLKLFTAALLQFLRKSTRGKFLTYQGLVFVYLESNVNVRLWAARAKTTLWSTYSQSLNTGWFLTECL
jgi:hypothetical protein